MEIFSRNLINPDVTNGENSFAKLQNLLVDYVSCLFKLTFNRKCITGGRRWLSWKVAGSIPDGAIEIFHLHILPATLWPWGRFSLEEKRVPGIFPGK